jgi:4-hydroxybenzoate polyprenyltransferase
VAGEPQREWRAGPRRLLTAVVLAFVHSNLLISLSATGVAVSTTVLAGLSLAPLPLAIVFAVTLFVYSFNRLADRSEDARNLPGRAAFVRRYGRGLLAVGAVLYLAAFAVALYRGVTAAPALALPAVVAVLYSVVGLKRVLLVKNLLVGLSWGLIPLGVGVYYDVLWTVDILFMFAFVTAVLTIAAAVFDIKDIEGDRAEGIQTVPVVLGVDRTRHLAAAASLAVGLVVAGLLVSGVLDAIYAVLLGFVAYVAGYSLLARRDRTPLFYGFVIDIEHVLLALVLLAVAWIR